MHSGSMTCVAIADPVRNLPPEEERAFCAVRALAYARWMHGDPDDTALMMRFRDGDVGAFEQLYRRHNDSLYRYLLRLCMNRASAEDIFQEAWGKIIRAKASYRPAARFSTYLYRVAHNCFIDHVRRNRRHLATAAFPEESVADRQSDPEVMAENALLRRRLDAALLDLPAEQRDVYLLYEECGFGIDEIAEVTGVKRETAKSRLRYASAKLRAALIGDTDTGHG